MTMRHLLLMLLCAAGAWAADVDLLGDGGGGGAATAGVATPRPDEDARRDAVSRLKKSFAADYARRSSHDKLALAHRLAAGAAAVAGSDWPMFDAMLSESMRLSSETDDCLGVLTCIERLAATFSGVDTAAEKRNVLRRMYRKPAAAAILKLLDAPDDQRANAIAGKWYAFEAGRWDDALPLLQRSGDDGLAAVAKMEAAKPANSAERLLVADAWHELGRKSSGEDRIGMYRRALAWYALAAPDLGGEDAARVKQTVAQIKPLVPLDLDHVDWSTLTAEDWERIAAPTVLVQAKLDRTDPQVVLADQQAVRIVPHPTETWTFGVYDLTAKVVCGWRGQPTVALLQNTGSRVRVGGGGPAGGGGGGGAVGNRRVTLGVNGLPYGSLLMWFDPNEKSAAGVITGPGKLWLGPSTDRTAESEASGAIRVKIIPVELPPPAAGSQPAAGR